MCGIGEKARTSKNKKKIKKEEEKTMFVQLHEYGRE